MKKRVDPGSGLLAIAAAQSGVLTREQTFAHGLGDDSVARLLRAGWWRRLAEGLYFSEPGAVPWLALAWGGVLLGGDHARVGGFAAAHLHNLSNAPPGVITILVPHGRRRLPRGPWQFLQERASIRRPSRGAPPRLDVEDTVLDVCDGATTAQLNIGVDRPGSIPGA